MITATNILESKILIVDDLPANVQLLERILKQVGYLGVTSTMDSTTVGELHREQNFDLILLDLHMPEMDGFLVIEELKTIEADGFLSLLVITAQPNQKLRALQAGARDFISKPFERSELLTRIHNLLEVRLFNEECKSHSKQLEETVRERTAELNRSEEKLRDLEANPPKAVWIGDTERQTIHYVNPAWRKSIESGANPGDPLKVASQTIQPEDQQ